jgi:hypothetical protein
MSPALDIKKSHLNMAVLREIASQEGPGITLLIPNHHPGAQEPSRSSMVRGMARSAAEQVAAKQLNSAGLLQPIEDYASAFASDEGGPGIALFRSPDLFETFTVPGIRESSVTVGRHFYLAPLLVAASVPQDFYVLALSRKKLHLYHYAYGRCQPVDLPVGVPPNMEVALDLDRPDHSLQNRTAAGSSTGSMRAVQFGTSSDREAADEHLHHFFQLVDRGLKSLFRETPVLLAGVHEEVAAYRKVARNCHLLGPEIHGNIDFLSPAEIADRASLAALAHYRRSAQVVLEKYKEMPERHRTLSTEREALDAAIAGRVYQLCVVEATGNHRSLPGDGGGTDEDMINATIVETLRHGGEVFMLPAVSMPEGLPLAAILRF